MSRGLPILMYHRIGKVNPKSIVPGHYVTTGKFARQLLVMEQLGYKTISLIEAIELWEVGKPIPKKRFVITFDDGYRNFHEYAQPILTVTKFNATVFLVSNQIGKNNAWDMEGGDVEEPLMSLSEIKECMAEGTHFGSHTLTHANVGEAEKTKAWEEIKNSKEDIEQLLGVECPTFCYPYGGWVPEARDMVEMAGYRGAVSTRKGLNSAETDRFLLRRINVRSDTTLPIFLYKLLRGGQVAG